MGCYSIFCHTYLQMHLLAPTASPFSPCIACGNNHPKQYPMVFTRASDGPNIHDFHLHPNSGKIISD